MKKRHSLFCPQARFHDGGRRARRRHAAGGDAVRVRQGTPLAETHRRGAEISSAKALAAKIGCTQSHVANIIGMVQISPKIIHAVIRGDYPETLTLASLKRKLPDLWSEQEAMLLGEN